MQKSKVQRFLAALFVAVMLVAPVVSVARAAEQSAPATLSAAEVTGVIPGGQFAKFWLGLTPTQPGATVTVRAEWDRMDALASGVGFYILTPENLARVQAGNDIRLNNLAAGGPVFQGSSNQQIASFNATGSDYTLVVYNDSSSDAKFTLTATNALISDDSGQVTGEEMEATATPAAPAAAPAPATVTATTVATATAVATTTVAAPAVATPAPAAPAAVTQPTVVRATEMKGSLPTEGSQNFLGLEPTIRDGEINLVMTFDPQDNQELARRIGFWVLDQQGLQRFTQGTPPSQLAIAAGSRTFLGESNERKATFNAAGFGPYTVIVYNNSTIPATYSLRVDGGILVDDSGQTETARASAGVTTTVAATTAPTAAATPATAAPATTTTTAATTGATGQPGGTYTVRPGDSLSIIARDIYGDIQLYDEICRFNNIADCNRIEVGDVIKLPTREQIASGAVAATTTTAPAAVATPATAPAAPAATTAVTRTATTTTTTTASPTTPVTRTATTTTTTSAPATGQDIVSVATGNGNFTILVRALQATGLDKTLQGGGPFTVFAPTDAAFEALGTATVEALLKDTAQLSQILRFHVVPNRIASSSITNGQEAATVLGSPVEFTVAGRNVKVQDSNIVVPDVAASNGVIHVIDKVMLPPAP